MRSGHDVPAFAQDCFSDYVGHEDAFTGSLLDGLGGFPSTGGLAPEARPTEGVVYLGLNGASREAEKAAFNGVANATVITGAGTDKAMQGKILSSDGKTVLDLANEADLTRYLSESQIDRRRILADGSLESNADALERMSKVLDLFLGKKDDSGERTGGIDGGARDEMATFVKHLQQVEAGEKGMDRIVMSGHSSGNWVYSEEEGNPGVSFKEMASLMEMFPQAQAGVKDLMLSACHTLEPGAGTDSGQQYLDIFPNLDDVMGYNGFSPSWKQGSTQHIRNWLGASKGDDPAKVVEAARRSGQNATAKTFP